MRVVKMNFNTTTPVAKQDSTIRSQPKQQGRR